MTETLLPSSNRAVMPLSLELAEENKQYSQETIAIIVPKVPKVLAFLQCYHGALSKDASGQMRQMLKYGLFFAEYQPQRRLDNIATRYSIFLVIEKVKS